MKLSTKVAQLTELLEPAVAACGVTLWGIEFMPQGRKSLLRIYIEVNDDARANGEYITIEDCTAVNHQVSGVLEVHDPIAGEYVLEVSSPGFDRPLFSPEQLKRYEGSVVSLRLIHAIGTGDAKRRKVQGKMLSATQIGVSVETDDHQIFEVAFDNIDKANLIYQD